MKKTESGKKIDDNSALPNADVIKKGLKAARLAGRIIVYKSTSSTNDAAARYAAGGIKNDGLVIFAAHQTAGRGRRENKWQSVYGKSILCSILIFEPKKIAGILPLACAVAAAKTIDSHRPIGAKIKWPNDILINNKKVAGILVEAKNIKGKNCFILGIGINCLQTEDDFKGGLENIATSIAIESKNKCDKDKTAKKLIENLEKYLNLAIKRPEKILEIYRDKNTLLGKRVTLESDGRKFTGTCIAIEPTDGIVLQLEKGGPRAFKAAVTTIRE